MRRHAAMRIGWRCTGPTFCRKPMGNSWPWRDKRPSSPIPEKKRWPAPELLIRMMKDFCLATCSRLEGHGSALLLSDHANDFQRFLQRGDLFTQPLNFALRGVVVLVELAVCGIELVLPLLPFGLGSCLFLRRLGADRLRSLLERHAALLVLGLAA